MLLQLTNEYGKKVFISTELIIKIEEIDDKKTNIICNSSIEPESFEVQNDCSTVIQKIFGLSTSEIISFEPNPNNDNHSFEVA